MAASSSTVRAALIAAVVAGGILAALVPGGCRRPGPTQPRLSFNEDIEPILSENCYSCHGPDRIARKAGLRLDRAQFALGPLEKGGPAILRGDPDHSPLIQRIESRDDKKRMPPAETHRRLDPGQVALFRRWIREGAEYQEHWAFIAPRRPEVPAPRRRDWARNDIDRFILARLEREGLPPSPEADRPELIRRLAYDLTGLPPSPAEVEAFLADPSPSAYEKAVDRLLASARYGEHRAHYWLDVARYGDTHGLHLDNFRSIWPYRDFVIRSFNDNKPYDQFVREQLAGDMLPAQNLEQLLGSAFIRAGISSGEGGTLVEELRFNNLRERTEAFGAAFLGLTVGCAVCHDHKFDPTTQRDFYQLGAFFNNLNEDPSNDDRSDWPPFIRLPGAEHRAGYDTTLARRAEVLRMLDRRRSQARDLVAAWLGAGRDLPRPVGTSGLLARLRFDEQQGAILANSAPEPAPDRRRFTALGGSPTWGEDTWFWPSFRMVTNTRLELPGIGQADLDDAFSVGTWIMPRLETKASKTPPYGAIIARMDAREHGRGWELWNGENRLKLLLVHAWPGDALEVETVSPVLARGRWNHILATYDGSGRAAGIRLFVDGERSETRVMRDRLTGTIRTAVPLTFGCEYPDAHPFRQSRYQDFRFYARALELAEASRVAFADRVAEIIARAPPAAWSEDEFKTVSDFYFTHYDRRSAELAAKLPPLNAELNRLSKDGALALVSEESPRLPYADILVRGLYNRRSERVRPQVPHFLPSLPAGSPRDRRGLADWTVSESNPLTARVAVNRMWAELFGTGLVATTEDFGVMGARPSHPRLLDWLAVDFRENGWNLKRFYKQLVMSAAYRQSARVSPGLPAKDPDNRLLARGPRFRMDAEMLRDTALAVSGLMKEKIGGPSVKPYQPPGVWEAGGYPTSNTTYYVQDHGEALYRRSLYTFWKRMSPMPNMDAFDAPARDGSCTRRQRTDTPLQALVSMNDPQWLEAARALAERVIRHDPGLRARLDYLGRLLLARGWRAKEEEILTGMLGKFRREFGNDAPAADRLLSVGESGRDTSLSAVEVASWMLVASTALNLDATLNK